MKLSTVQQNNRLTTDSPTTIKLKTATVPKLSKKKKGSSLVKKLTSVILILLVLAVSLSGYLYFYVTNGGRSNKNSHSVNTNSETQKGTVSEVDVKKPEFIQSPVNGVLMTKEAFENKKNQPPLVVIIENEVSSRPQTGFNKADITFETLAEGGITRTVNVYWSNDAEKILPVRSARKYFVDLTGDFTNSVFMHIGYAEGADNVNALLALNKYKVRNLGFTQGAFARDLTCQKTKAIEHCAYTSTGTLLELIKGKGWDYDINDQQTWKYRADNKPEIKAGGDLTDFKIEFSELNSENYNVIWRYDKASNTYKRYGGNNLPFKEVSGEQVESKVVIYQKINSYLANDAKRHMVQEVIGQGTGSVMQNGKVYDITWKKTDYKTRTKYYDSLTNEEFIFEPGKTWVTLIGKSLNYIDLTPKPTEILATPAQ